MIRHLSYQSIPQALRIQKAGEAQRRLQMILSDPLSTIEQRAAAQARQQQLRQWTAGTLPEVRVEAPVSEPEGHVDAELPIDVEVEEKVPAIEPTS